MDLWLRGLTDLAAQNLEHYRKLRGISRAELARRCSRAGLPMLRPALAGMLDGHRQTITLQELVVLAGVLEVTVVELVLPLHTGRSVSIGGDGPTHPYIAAIRLFGMSEAGSSDRLSSYAPFARYLLAAERFAKANARLARMSRRMATGDEQPNESDGRPHPASEVLATEAAASRLLEARAELDSASLVAPPIRHEWSFLNTGATPTSFPVFEHLDLDDFPLYVYTLSASGLPAAVLVSAHP